jgi:hypothetical protein
MPKMSKNKYNKQSQTEMLANHAKEVGGTHTIYTNTNTAKSIELPKPMFYTDSDTMKTNFSTFYNQMFSEMKTRNKDISPDIILVMLDELWKKTITDFKNLPKSQLPIANSQ